MRYKRLHLIFYVLGILSCNTAKKENADHIFIYNETSGISSLDPVFAKNQANMWPVHQIFNTLVEVKEDLTYGPSIATSWYLDSTRKRLTFQLRNDIFFHDDKVFKNGKGRRLVASDICFSLSRLVSPETASPGAWVLNELVDTLEPFSAPNDSTFVLTLKKPFTPILGILSMPYCSVVPYEAVRYYGKEFSRKPIGTGPFRFVSWHENQAITLTKNQHYFETDISGKRLPYLDGVQITFLPGKSAEFIAFQQNKIDFMNDVDPSFKDELLTKSGKLQKKWNGKIQLKKSDFLNTEYLGINMMRKENNALSEKFLRKAISHAIDRKKLLFYLRNSIGVPADKGFVPGGLNAYHEQKSIEIFNLTLAKKYLDSSGYKTLSAKPVIVLTTVPNYSSLGSYICSELNKLGIQCKLDVIQKSVLLEQMSSGDVSFFRGSWIADYPDPTNYFSVLYGKSPAPPNYTRFANHNFDLLYENVQAETDKKKRDSMFLFMDGIISEELPVIPLWYDQVVHFYQKGIRNLNPNPQNMLELKRVMK